MNKEQARNMLRQVFSESFNRQQYEQFLTNLLGEITPGSRASKHYSGTYIPNAYQQQVKQYWCLGKYIDPNKNVCDLQVVQVKHASSLTKARAALRNFAVNRLKQFDKETGLFAFYATDDNGADWRFSFVKIEYSAYQDNKSGTVKNYTTLTPAKRYSFLLGKYEYSHTAASQVLPLLEDSDNKPTLKQLEDAFSVDRVTDEFFRQYKNLFDKLVEHLQSQPYFQQQSNSEQAMYRFAKKLLGQIVFLYFLQKKGWLGVAKNDNWGDGPRDFLRQQFQATTAKGEHYYHDFMQYLFYEALANERKNQTDLS